jgi:hypothetical protein
MKKKYGYFELMSQPEYMKAREFAMFLNYLVRRDFKHQLRGVKRYVDPRVKGVSTKYVDVDPQLADELVEFISRIPVPPAMFKVRVERVDKEYTSVRLSVGSNRG